MSYIYRFDYFAWIAGGYRVFRDIPCDYTPGTDSAIVADCYAWKYRDVCPNPDIISYRNRACELKSTVSFNRIKRMTGRVKSAVRPDKHIVAKRNRRLVENYHIEVGIEIQANLYIVTIIAVKRLLNQDVAR